MKDQVIEFNPDFSTLARDDWFDALDEFCEEHGYFEPLGNGYAAGLIDSGPKLLVTFETYETICKSDAKRRPLGFRFVKEDGWSNLCILCAEDSAFRYERLYKYFDRLVDDGFFEDFDEVLFFGEHLAGYAAAAYSVAAPGAKVFALRPIATADPEHTAWDNRLLPLRKQCFTDRYGYAPDMLEGCQSAFLVYDPKVLQDAVHAALFRADYVTPLKARHFGPLSVKGLQDIGILDELLRQAMTGNLSAESFAKLYRARRTHKVYLRRVLAAVTKTQSVARQRFACKAILARGDYKFAADALEQIS